MRSSSSAWPCVLPGSCHLQGAEQQVPPSAGLASPLLCVASREGPWLGDHQADLHLSPPLLTLHLMVGEGVVPVPTEILI